MAAVRLKNVDLSCTGLTTLQSTTLLQTILAEKEERVMEGLNLKGNELGKVDRQLLGQIETLGMKTLDLGFTYPGRPPSGDPGRVTMRPIVRRRPRTWSK